MMQVVLSACLAAAVLASSASAAAVPRRPNAIIISIEGLNRSMLGSYGNEEMAPFTKNIDRVGRRGAVFENAFAEHGSSPSRVSLLTGRHAVRAGFYSHSKFILSLFSPAQATHIDDSQTTLAELVKLGEGSRYQAGMIGTWHLGFGEDGAGLPRRHGFDYFLGSPMPVNSRACSDPPGARDYQHTFYIFWGLSSMLWQSMVLALLLMCCFGALRREKCMLLFVLTLGLALVPFFVLDGLTLSEPLSCILIRDERIVQQPLQWEGYLEKLKQESRHFLQSQMECSRNRCRGRNSFVLYTSLPLPAEGQLSPRWRNHTKLGDAADAIAEVDHQVGQILDLVSHLGLDLTSLVTITGTNVDRFSRDQTLMPQRIPLMMQFERHIPEGKRVSAAVDLVDFAPTMNLLSGAGMHPQHFDGISLWDLVTEEDEPEIFQRRQLRHFCGSVMVGMTEAHHTVMMERGAGPHLCRGTRLDPPMLCGRINDPDCKRITPLGATLPPLAAEPVGNILGAWSEQSSAVAENAPAPKLMAYPWPAAFPCCVRDPQSADEPDDDGDDDTDDGEELGACECDQDAPPAYGQAPRPKKRAGARNQAHV